MKLEKMTKAQLIDEIGLLRKRVKDLETAESGRLQAEEKLSFHTKVVSDVVFTANSELVIESVSPSVKEVFGFEPEMFTGRKYDELMSITGESHEAICENTRRLLKGEESGGRQYTIVAADGTKRHIEASGTPFVRKGEIVGVIGVLRDVTVRKRTEQALQEIEEKFLTFVNESAYVYFETDLEGRFTFASRRIEDLMGHTPEQIIGMNAVDLLVEEDRPRARENLRRVVSEPRREPREYRARMKDGTVLHIEVTTLPLRREGELVGFHYMVLDITERRKAEEALRRSEERFRMMAETSPDYIFEIDCEGRILYRSPAGEKMIGYSREEREGSYFISAVAESDRDRTLALFREVLAGKPVQGVEVEVLHKNGGTVCLEANAVPITRDGAVKGAFGIARDITDRKRVKEALRESEQKYRTLVENTNDIAYSMDAQGILTYLGPQVRRYGIEPEEALSTGFWSLIVPEDREKLAADIQRSLTTGEEFPSEFRLLDKEGQAHWLEEQGKVLRDESGCVVGISGMLRDITERKQTESALRESEERWRSLVENAPNIIMMLDREGTIQFVNHTVPGITVEEVVGRSQYDYIEPEYHEVVKQTLQEVFETGQPGRYQIRGTGPDGMVSWYETNVSPVKSGTQVVSVTLIVTDITERRRAEESLRESEEKFRNMSVAAQDAIIMLDSDGKISYWNNAAERIFKYQEDEVVGKEMHTFLGPERYHESYRQAFGRFSETGEGPVVGRTMELAAIRKDGTEFPMELSVSATKVNGKWCAVGILRDITERKQVEHALRESEEKWRSLVENAPSVIIIVDPSGTILFLNRTVSGRKVKDAIGSRIYDYTSHEHHDTIRETIEQVIQTGQPGRYETKGEGPDGRISWYETYVGPIMSGDRVTGATLVSTDITERKQAARRLAEAQEKERSRLSERLHGDVGQLLTLSKIKVDRLRDARLDDMGAITKELSEVSGLLADILEKTRDLSQALRPPLIDQFGLAPALKALSAEFRRDTGIDIAVDVGEPVEEIPAEVAVHIYRVVQEALTNVAKHAQADSARVTITVEDGHALLTVTDNGKGFDVGKLEQRTDCLGVRSMRSRVADSGGAFTISSRISVGTEVRARIPLVIHQ